MKAQIGSEPIAFSRAANLDTGYRGVKARPSGSRCVDSLKDAPIFRASRIGSPILSDRVWLRSRFEPRKRKIGRIMFAVIRTGGKQYKVAKDDVISVEKLPAEPGAVIELAEVLMIGDGAQVAAGAPLLDGASVSATV